MQTTGMIYLLDKVGEKIDGKQYHSPSRRQEIINTWRRLYAAMFSTCHIQIAPSLDMIMCDEKGLNTRVRNGGKPRGGNDKYISAMPGKRFIKEEIVSRNIVRVRINSKIN